MTKMDSNAIEKFVQGWTRCRWVPRTEIKRLDRIWHVHFGSPVGGRTDEFFIEHDKSTAAIKTIRGDWASIPHWLTVSDAPLDLTVTDYELTHSEYLMTYDLDCVTNNETVQIKRIQTFGETEKLNRRFGKTIMSPDRLKDPHARFYSVEIDEEPVAYGRYSLLDGVACLDSIFTSECH